MKDVAVLYSGGKDSTYTIELLKKQGFRVACLITVVSENEYSYMLHTSNISLSKLSSQALQIPLVLGKTQGRKEGEVEDIRQTVAIAQDKYVFDTLSCGGIASAYQETRVQKIADKLGLDVVCPLWGIDQEKYLYDLISAGYDFILTSVSAAGLDESWLGKRIDENAIGCLVRLSKKFGFNPALEGGEGESLVLDCPIFQHERLKILESTVRWNGYVGNLVVLRACLEKKK